MSWFSKLFGGDKRAEAMKMEGRTHASEQNPMSGMKGEAGSHPHPATPASGAEMAKDPVCGMDVNVGRAAATSEHEGRTYYFCAPGCKKAFDENPSRYLKAAGSMSMHDTSSGRHGCCD